MDETWTALLHSAPQLGFWLMIRSVHVADVAAGAAKILLRVPDDSKNTAQARQEPGRSSAQGADVTAEAQRQTSWHARAPDR
jgi:hypothetical protein